MTGQVITVSSHTNLLYSADKVLAIKNGEVIDQGPGKALFHGIFADDTAPKAPDDTVDQTREAAGSAAAVALAKKAGETLTVREAKSTGAVKRSVYRAYFHAAYPSLGGRKVMLMIFIAYAIGQAARVFCDLWIAWWGEVVDRGGLHVDNSTHNAASSGGVPNALLSRVDDAHFWILSLGMLNIGNMVLALIRSLLCAALSVWSSREIHRRAVSSLLKAPLLYFQENPPGRIMNKLSTDLHRVDCILPDMLYQFLDNLFILISAVILVFIALPWLLLILVVVLPFFWFIQRLYRGTSRELLRLDGLTKSPIYSAFSEMVMNRVTIRAFEAQEMFFSRALRLHDKHLKIAVTVKMLERWVSNWLNFTVRTFCPSLYARAHQNAANVGSW